MMADKNNTTIQVRAPASVMLAGEHAVLRGYLSIVAAVDQYMHVGLTPRNNDVIDINTDTLGSWAGKINKITVEQPFQFVLAVLKRYQKLFSNGFALDIKSDFSSQLGLGSSAAVTVATVSAVRQFLNLTTDGMTIFVEARDIIQQVQGAGSGADVAACVFGGVVAYRAVPLHIECLPALPPLKLVYSGGKMPTVEVIKQLNIWCGQHDLLAKKIFRAIEQCSQQARKALLLHNWALLGEIFKVQQGLMCELQLSNDALDSIVSKLEEAPGILGAKISGSGLGDCVVAVGELSDSYFPMNDKQKQQGIKSISINVVSRESWVVANESY